MSILEESPLAQTDIASTTERLCKVCNEKESKYKCPRCYLPYCSIACSTLHKATHAADKPEPVPKPQVEPVKRPNGTVARPGTVAAIGAKGPFDALDDSTELHTLFKLYPNLPTLLDEINNTTLPPVNDPPNGDFKNPRQRKEEPWNLDRGLQKGVEALKRSRSADDKDGESLREYSKLILQILSGEAAEIAERVIEQELKAENIRIVEQLLQVEK